MADLEPMSDEAINEFVELVRAAEITALQLGMSVTQAFEVQMRFAAALRAKSATVIDMSQVDSEH